MTPLAALTPTTAALPPTADGTPRAVRWYDVRGERPGYTVPFVAVVTCGAKATGYGVEPRPAAGHRAVRVRKAGDGGAYTVTCGPLGAWCDCPAGEVGHVDACRHVLLVQAAVAEGWL